MKATKKYCVRARGWDEELAARFGELGSVHTLTDTEVVDAIITFGRASIDQACYTFGADLILYFENDYD
jgi:hypothetical protein